MCDNCWWNGHGCSEYSSWVVDSNLDGTRILIICSKQEASYCSCYAWSFTRPSGDGSWFPELLLLISTLTWLQTKGFSLRSIKYLVLDEADRLLDLDFGPVLDKILKVGNKRRMNESWAKTPAESTIRRSRISSHLSLQCDNEFESRVSSTSISSQPSPRIDQCDLTSNCQEPGASKYC